MVTAATSTEMTLLMLASVSASLAVFYWRDWQTAIVHQELVEAGARDVPMAGGRLQAMDGFDGDAVNDDGELSGKGTELFFGGINSRVRC